MTGPQQEMFGGRGTPDGTVAVNARCLVRSQDGHRVVLVAGIVLCQYSVGDRMAEAHAMVSLVEQGWADQREVATALGCASRTVRRLQRRFEAGGLPALARTTGYPVGRPRLPGSRSSTVLRLKAHGYSNREIARRLGVNEKAIRKVLLRLGWRPPRSELAHPGAPTAPSVRHATRISMSDNEYCGNLRTTDSAELAKKAGIAGTVSPHRLRHSVGMAVHARTGDVLITARVLCHRSVASTAVYARVSDAQVRAAIGA